MILPVQIDKGGYRKFGYKSGRFYHAGHDFNCGLNEIVRSVANGVVLFSSQISSGFGGYKPNKPGGVLIIRHFDSKGNAFVALYGHIESDIIDNENVVQGQRLGHVHQYVSDGIKLPHLHYGINLFDGIPESPWGYVKDLAKLGWVDPIEFHKNK